VQFIVMVHGFDEGRFDRHEHQHEFQAVYAGQITVAALGELLDVRAHRCQMRAELHAALVVVARGAVALVRCQRHLRVDDQVAPFGQVHDHVRPRPSAVVVFQRYLRLVLAAFLQAGRLEQAFEHEFTPDTLRSRLALQRTGQIQRVLADALVDLLERIDLVLEQLAFAAFLVIDLGHGPAKIAELLAQRIEQGAQAGDVLLAEPAALFLEQFAGHCLEAVTELLADAFEHRLALLGRMDLFLQARGGFGQALLGALAGLVPVLRIGARGGKFAFDLRQAFEPAGERGALARQRDDARAMLRQFAHRGVVIGVQPLQRLLRASAFGGQLRDFAVAARASARARVAQPAAHQQPRDRRAAGESERHRQQW
jgi:hypothetical protein